MHSQSLFGRRTHYLLLKFYLFVCKPEELPGHDQSRKEIREISLASGRTGVRHPGYSAPVRKMEFDCGEESINASHVRIAGLSNRHHADTGLGSLLRPE